MRAPLKPFSVLTELGRRLEGAGAVQREPERLDQVLERDRSTVREHLTLLANDPLVQEAIWLSSPSLFEALERWRAEPDSRKGLRAELAFFRYIARLSWRPTPFGLFAACSLGDIGDQTQLQVPSRFRRYTRLDMGFVQRLVDTIVADPDTRKELRFELNSSIYYVGDRVRFVEPRIVPAGRAYSIQEIQRDQYVDRILGAASSDASVGALCQALVEDGVTVEEAEHFVNELIDCRLLVPTIEPRATGNDPLASLLDALASMNISRDLTARLETVLAALRELDASTKPVSPTRYQAIKALLPSVPQGEFDGTLFQVDMVGSETTPMIGQEVVKELARGAELLARLTPKLFQDPLRRFRDEFQRRYEMQEVALTTALDPEVGVGFPPGSAEDGAPAFVRELAPHPSAEPVGNWRARDTALLRALTQVLRAGHDELSLTDADLEELEPEDRYILPEVYYVCATIAARSSSALNAGDFRVLVDSCAGPPGARLIGRFCHVEDRLRDSVIAHLRKEEACRPAAVFAEVVHIPQGRLGNVILRPVMRAYEIPYLSPASVASPFRIQITDLMLSVQGDGRLVLRSQLLGVEVIPRVTNAYNGYAQHNLPVYAFLSWLQHQESGLGKKWDWGALSEAPFLPRVRCGRLILSRAQWRLTPSQRLSIANARGSELFKVVTALRRDIRLPRWVLLHEGDNALPCDLENVVSLEALAHVLRRENRLLTELYPDSEEFVATNDSGTFMHAIVVPFIRSSSSQARRPAASETSRPRSAGTVARIFPPGSEWLYLKIFCAPRVADSLLSRVFAPLLQESLAGLVDRWFFVRYYDPRPHLRLRFHGEAKRLSGEVLPLCMEALSPLAQGGECDIQVATYVREIERYGGPDAMGLSEAFFHADSEAVLAILREPNSAFWDPDARWRLAFLGAATLCSDFDWSFQQPGHFLEERQGSWASEYEHERKRISKLLAQRYRAERQGLMRLLDHPEEAVSPVQMEALRKRSEQVRVIARSIRAMTESQTLWTSSSNLVSSYIHMHVNRMMAGLQRTCEFVLFDYLRLIHRSIAARNASGGNSSKPA
jgi:thiopeptide-type bacteriocin biosynthesis protein